MMDFLSFLSLFSKPNIGRMLARLQQALAAALIHNSAQTVLKCLYVVYIIFPQKKKNNLPLSLENRKQFAKSLMINCICVHFYFIFISCFDRTGFVLSRFYLKAWGLQKFHKILSLEHKMRFYSTVLLVILDQVEQNGYKSVIKN